MTHKHLVTRAGSVLACLVGLAAGIGCITQSAAGADDALRLRGQRLFLRCGSCHDISDSTIARIGPSLKDVVGRKAGSLPGYGYSPAMKAAGFTWDEAMLSRWLIDPAALVPGTSMAFAGLPKEEDRDAIIAYLRQPKP